MQRKVVTSAAGHPFHPTCQSRDTRSTSARTWQHRHGGLTQDEGSPLRQTGQRKGMATRTRRHHLCTPNSSSPPTHVYPKHEPNGNPTIRTSLRPAPNSLPPTPDSTTLLLIPPTHKPTHHQSSLQISQSTTTPRIPPRQNRRSHIRASPPPPFGATTATSSAVSEKKKNRNQGKRNPRKFCRGG